MLLELSKDDKKWRDIALYICKDKDLADDLTNDMYIKLYDSGKKYSEINQWFVYVTIKNLYIDHLRRLKKEMCFTDILSISEEDLVNVGQYECREALNAREMINQALNELHFFDREILLHTAEKSLRKTAKHLNGIEDETGKKKVFSARTLHYLKKNALEKLKETETIKNYDTTRRSQTDI